MSRPPSAGAGTELAPALPSQVAIGPRLVGPVRLWIGRGLTLAALGFVGWKLVDSGAWALAEARDPRAWGLVVVAALVYATASLLLSTAWQRLLLWLGEPHARPAACHRIYGRAQIAKYVPGNVAHLVRRHALGREAGFAHAPLIASNFAEGLLALAACGLIAALALALRGPIHPGVSAPRAWGIVVLLFVAVATLAFGWRAPAVRRRLKLDPHSAGAHGHHGLLLQAFGLYTAFLLTAGLELAALAWIGGSAPSPAAAVSVVPVLAVALMAGFLTPGAPAGAGAREAVLVLGATPLLGEPASVMLAIGFRVVSLLGDALFWLGATWGARARPR